VPAKGYVKGNSRRIVVSLDDDVFEEIGALAKAHNCSMAEEIRCLIDWGIEGYDNA
jgi:hypothetical protein